jgi:hypothetical protein
VVIRGKVGALNWPALSKWSNEYLIQEFGQETVHADATSNGRVQVANSTHVHKGTRTQMTWSKFLASVMKQDKEEFLGNNGSGTFYALPGKPMATFYPYLAVDVSRLVVCQLNQIYSFTDLYFPLLTLTWNPTTRYLIQDCLRWDPIRTNLSRTAPTSG